MLPQIHRHKPRENRASSKNAKRQPGVGVSQPMEDMCEMDQG
jgi:hypothetical protein